MNTAKIIFDGKEPPILGNLSMRTGTREEITRKLHKKLTAAGIPDLEIIGNGDSQIVFSSSKKEARRQSYKKQKRLN